MGVLILMSFFSTILIYVVILNVSHHHFESLQLLLVICISSLLSIIILLINPQYELLGNMLATCVATIFLIWKTKDVLFSIIFTILGMMIILISTAVASFVIFALAGNGSMTAVRENLCLYCFNYTLLIIPSYLISKLAGNLIQKLRKVLSIYFKGIHIAYILFGLLLVLIAFYFNFFISKEIHDPTIISAVNGVTSIVYLAFLAGSVYIFMIGVKNSMESAHKQDLLEALQDYTSNLENLYEDMRNFRHNYLNDLSGLYGYIQNNDLEGLTAYFIANIMPNGEKIKHTLNAIDTLKNIHIPEIKGLLALKLMQAQERDIKVLIVIEEVIDSINFDIVDMIKIIGILLDNAVEACQESKEEPYIKFAIIKTNHTSTMFVTNPIHPSHPPISEMLKKGFSTKGEGRGLGLYIVRQIIDKNKHAVLNTYTENNEFKQELILENKLADGD